MKAFYVIGGVACFMGAFANAYAFTYDKKLYVRAMDLVLFGINVFCAVYWVVKAAML
jgi:hypothetical protein